MCDELNSIHHKRKAETAKVDVTEGSEDSRVILKLMLNGLAILRKQKRAPSIKEMLLGCDLSSDPSQRAALSVCEQLQWADCVKTTLSAESFAAKPGKGRAILIELAGWPTLNHHVDMDKFAEKVSVAVLDPHTTEVFRKMVTVLEAGGERP
jgi:hypothetical protein